MIFWGSFQPGLFCASMRPALSPDPSLPPGLCSSWPLCSAPSGHFPTTQWRCLQPSLPELPRWVIHDCAISRQHVLPLTVKHCLCLQTHCCFFSSTEGFIPLLVFLFPPKKAENKMRDKPATLPPLIRKVKGVGEVVFRNVSEGCWISLPQTHSVGGSRVLSFIPIGFIVLHSNHPPPWDHTTLTPTAVHRSPVLTLSQINHA